ncbi:MAG: sugar phosphate isomerase/epimerase family protein [Actinomycetota bacterium]
MNRIGANTWIWSSPLDDEALARHARRLSEWGFDLIELPLETLDDWSVAAARRTLRETGLGAVVCIVMSSDRDLVHPDAAIVKATQDYLSAAVEVAAELDSSVVCGPMYSSVGRTWRILPEQRPYLLERLAQALAPVVGRAEAAGVRLAIEPLNRFETSLFNTTGQALELVEEVDSPACGLLLDTFHMNIEERDPATAIAAARGHLVHFHACANDRGAPGDDHLDWEGLASALRRVGYAGAVCIESFTAANEAIATAASVWRPLAVSQDDIATRGLSFLRSLLAPAEERR